MTSYSKHFYETMKTFTCADGYHIHTPNCTDMLIPVFTQNIKGCFKFFIPIAMMPLALKIRKFNKKLLVNSFRDYLNHVFALWMCGSLSLVYICFARYLTGGINRMTLVGIPGFFAALSTSPFMNEKSSYMYGQIHIATLIEMLLRTTDERKRHVIVLTILFMLSNAILLQGLRYYNQNVYWFYKPLRTTDNDSNNNKKNNKNSISSPIVDLVIKAQEHVCLHKGSCDSYIGEGIWNFTKIGLIIEFIRTLISNAQRIRQNPLGIATLLRSKLKWKLIAFFGSYAGIYRISNCLLNRYYKKESSLAHFQSSFLAGMSFYFYPKITFLAHAIATALEMIWVDYANKSKKNPSHFVHKLKNVSLGKWIFVLCFGFAAHFRSVYPWIAPELLKQFMSIGTDGCDGLFIKNIFIKMNEDSPAYILYLFGLRNTF